MRLYLLSGNGSMRSWFADCLPFFEEKEPIPLELPGYGDNASTAYGSMGDLADALLEMTEEGNEIFAVGINALVVLHALVRKPGHFSRVYLLAPVGAFLEERRFVAVMRGPLVAKLGHFLLSRFPKLFRRKFSSREWTAAQYARMGEGYRRCKAFTQYFKFVQGWNATDLFEWIEDPIVLIWGAGDAVLDLKQVAAWDTILPRAELEICIKDDWEHYPYIDDPKEFAAFMEGRSFSGHSDSRLSAQSDTLGRDDRQDSVEGNRLSTHSDTLGRVDKQDPRTHTVARTENSPQGFPSHTKAGRLELATLAGLPVPAQRAVRNAHDAKAVADWAAAGKLYAVRSSGANEDHIDHSNAGINTTFLRVPKEEVEARAMELLGMGLATAVVQEFVEPVVSGVAFVRWVSAEIEMVPGHLEGLVSGTLDPVRVTCSKLGEPWRLREELGGNRLSALTAVLGRADKQLSGNGSEQLSADGSRLSAHSETLGRAGKRLSGDGDKRLSVDEFIAELWAFLRRCIQTFHYAHSDIEWAWDGRQFWMLQIRPVTAYAWRRSLSSANLNEILPAQVSRIMEHAQRRASLSIGRLYGLWDKRNLRDNEPFTALSDDASYLNLDLFLARFHDWGLPSNLIAKEIGGAAPPMPFHLGRFVRNIPTFLRMQRNTRREILRTEAQIRAFEKELTVLEQAQDPAALARWFTRYYVFIVRQNMVINACLSSAMGSFLGRPKTAYAKLGIESEELRPDDAEFSIAPHRLKFESDPASPRDSGEALPLEGFPRWSWMIRVLHRLGAPGMGGKYFEVREWFRDNNMRLFFRLHHALKGSDWLERHSAARTKSGAFWQDGSGLLQQTHGFVIYPGSAEGWVGTDILIVDALEPGHYEDYKKAKAVVARTGGRLSHGATLLRELKKPSAVVPGVEGYASGTLLRYRDGVLEGVPPAAG